MESFSSLELPIVCFAVGMMGCALGAWLCSRGARARLKRQQQALDLAREKAERDLQQALLCVPQWMQQTVRLELEILGRQQTERWKELVAEQQRWQFGQDVLRRGEWQALRAGPSGRHVSAAPASPTRRPPPSSSPAAAPIAPAVRVLATKVLPAPSLARPPESQEIQQLLPHPVAGIQAQPEQELTDEQIDALPPDLPVPTHLPRRKLPAPKGPVLRNL